MPGSSTILAGQDQDDNAQRLQNKVSMISLGSPSVPGHVLKFPRLILVWTSAGFSVWLPFAWYGMAWSVIV